jgi:pantetheine-phosphate adenylyltransferase
MSTIAVYPGTFDPPTNGHVGIIRRGLKVFDKVIIVIMNNKSKAPLFTVEERIELLEESLKDLKNIEVASYEGMVVDYAVKRGAKAILRGMRAVSDFEGEFQLAMYNRRLNREIETVFLMTGLRWLFISSSGIKELASFGGKIAGMVPKCVEKRLIEKFPIPVKDEGL